MPELRKGELPEYTFHGPWGGVQSQVASDLIERLGFRDANNIMFRHGLMESRPGIAPYVGPDTAGDPVLAWPTFFDSKGARFQTAFTKSKGWAFDSVGQIWAPILGALTGSNTDRISWTTVGQKLVLANGVDKLQLWSGAGGFANAAADAPIAKYVCEISNYVLAANLVAGGVPLPQRIQWSGIGDPSVWSGFESGQTDLFNDLGPIQGVIKLYQAGYAFHRWGVSQLIPTGLGRKPFDFVSLQAHSKGLAAPWSLAPFGENEAAYLGDGNVYNFDGSASTAIGDMPLIEQGFATRTRLGARKRIIADTQIADLNTIFGFRSTSINGFDYNAYWLFIPGISTWVYNFDESNWTRFSFEKAKRSVAVFNTGLPPTIGALQGEVADQTWQPAYLTATTPLDAVIMGDDDGGTQILDFTQVCEVNWSVTTGQWSFGDRRHEKTVKQLRYVLEDTGVQEFTITLENEKGESKTATISAGTGSGKALVLLVNIRLTGTFFVVTTDGLAGKKASISELTPVFDIANEVRGSVVIGENQ
jgi:hypothetical protein